MATLSQITANRLNAQHSTGPSSVEGKAVTRFNAMKHGIDAASLVIPGEDPAELAQLAEDFQHEYRPQGATESVLVQTLLRSEWLKRRYFQIEAQVMKALVQKQEDPAADPGIAFLADAVGHNAMGKLHRRQQAAQRDWNKALDQLLKIQAARLELAAITSLVTAPATGPQPAPSAPADRPHPKPIPGQPWVGSEPPSWRL